MKKGAIHIDWVISVGIFLVYIIVLLVLIKPSYKSVYEGDALTTMIKDEFLRQNKVDAGFVVFKAENCDKIDGVNVIQQLSEKTGSNIFYIKRLKDPNYKAYFLPEIPSSEINLGNCEIVEVGEVFNYTGLKQGLNFEAKDFNFPISRNYKITIYPGESVVPITRDGNTVTIVNPTSETKVYVLDWSAAKLKWENNEIGRDNIIINIQVW